MRRLCLAAAVAAALASPALAETPTPDARLIDCAAYYGIRAAEAGRGIGGPEAVKRFVKPAETLNARARAALVATGLSEREAKARIHMAAEALMAKVVQAGDRGESFAFEETACEVWLK